jgi:hypothetical protein
LIAYETAAREGMVLDEGVIVEIVRPGTGDPVAEGEVGELVVTTLNPDYPLIRFGTGDLTAILPGMCPQVAPTSASKAGWVALTRPPKCAACLCIQAKLTKSSNALRRSAKSAFGGQRRNGARPNATCIFETSHTIPTDRSKWNKRCATSPNCARTS